MDHGIYHSATFGQTIDPFSKYSPDSASSRGGFSLLRQGAEAIKEKFLNQRMLKARVKMPPKHARTEQGNALHVQRDEKPTAEARA